MAISSTQLKFFWRVTGSRKACQGNAPQCEGGHHTHSAGVRTTTRCGELAARRSALLFSRTRCAGPPPRAPPCSTTEDWEPMAKHCDICGKSTVFGQQVSHAHNVTKRTWEPNLQRVRAMIAGK